MEHLANWNNLISLLVFVFTWTIKPCLNNLQKSIDRLSDLTEKQGVKIEGVQVSVAENAQAIKSAHKRIDQIEETLRHQRSALK